MGIQASEFLKESKMKYCLVICLNLFAALLIWGASNANAQSSTFPEATCKELKNSIFKPCICYDRTPKLIQYRPTLAACGGKAAAILNGGLADSFSVVLRDKMNRDRWPASGYHGCSAKQVEAGLNKCSAFKCQKVIQKNDQQVCCFGETGSSKILAGATRMTLKLRDLPNSKFDPLLRVCLNKFSPKLNLN